MRVSGSSIFVCSIVLDSKLSHTDTSMTQRKKALCYGMAASVQLRFTLRKTDLSHWRLTRDAWANLVLTSFARLGVGTTPYTQINSRLGAIRRCICGTTSKLYPYSGASLELIRAKFTRLVSVYVAFWPSGLAPWLNELLEQSPAEYFWGWAASTLVYVAPEMRETVNSFRRLTITIFR